MRPEAAENRVSVAQDEQADAIGEKQAAEAAENKVSVAQVVSTGEAKRLKEKIRKKKNKKKNQVEELKMQNARTRDNICWKGIQVDSKSEAA
jgi:hypothetical protein